MTPYANRALRRLHIVAIIAIGMAIAGLLLGHVRLALAAIIPVLFIVLISLDRLRASQAKSEKP